MLNAKFYKYYWLLLVILIFLISEYIKAKVPELIINFAADKLTDSSKFYFSFRGLQQFFFRVKQLFLF